MVPMWLAGIAGMAVAVAQTSAELDSNGRGNAEFGRYLKIRKSLTAGARAPNCPHSPILLDLNILVLFGVWGSI